MLHSAGSKSRSSTLLGTPRALSPLALTEGIEVARIALGHKDDRVTRRYAVSAEQDLAISVARKHR